MIEQVKDPLLQQTSLNNPYHAALSILVRRLRWDLTIQSWISRKRLRKLKDIHCGEKAVILCNGPSLLRVDLSHLETVFTFGLNKINLLFTKTLFRPSVIVAVNELVLEQNREFYDDTEIPLFLDSQALRFIRPRRNVIFLHSDSTRKFARDCSMSIYQSHTVTFVALQLAFHMGFKEVALVGCDHNFHVHGPENALVTSQGDDKSHFDPNYFGPGIQWNLPDLFESEVGYTMARKVYEAFGRRVVNATEGGNLEVFPRQSLNEFLGTKF